MEREKGSSGQGEKRRQSEGYSRVQDWNIFKREQGEQGGRDRDRVRKRTL